MGLEVNY